MGHPAVVGHLGLESLDLWPEDEALFVEDPQHSALHLLADGGVLRAQVEQGYGELVVWHPWQLTTILLPPPG